MPGAVFQMALEPDDVLDAVVINVRRLGPEEGVLPQDHPGDSVSAAVDNPDQLLPSRVGEVEVERHG